MRLAISVLLSMCVAAACGGKAEPTARERVAAVIEKDKPAAKTDPQPAKNVAPDPAAPKKTAPVKAEPTKTEPAKVEAKVAPEPVKVEAKAEPEPVKVEPAKVEPVVEPAEKVEAKTEPTEPSEPTGPTGQALFSLTVNDAALALGIDNRFPTERKTSFTIGSDPKVVAWFDFKNSGTPANVAFVWKKAGKEIWRIAVDVGAGKNWRTWAEKKIGKKDAGRWTVEVVDEAGHVYESLSYDVTGS